MLRPTLVFGRVPLFYFLLHLPLIHFLAVILCYGMNGAVHWMFESPNLGAYPFTPPPVWGLSLPIIYLIWMAVVADAVSGLRVVCIREAAATDAWLSYL